MHTVDLTSAAIVLWLNGVDFVSRVICTGQRSRGDESSGGKEDGAERERKERGEAARVG